MFSCGDPMLTARYSSKHTAAGATTTCMHWFVGRRRLARYLAVWWVLHFHWAAWSAQCIDHHFSLNAHVLCRSWLLCRCPHTMAQLGDILSYPSEQMPAKSNSAVMPMWKTVLFLTHFCYCYEIIDEYQPTHGECGQKQLVLEETAPVYPCSHMHHPLMAFISNENSNLLEASMKNVISLKWTYMNPAW